MNMFCFQVLYSLWTLLNGAMGMGNIEIDPEMILANDLTAGNNSSEVQDEYDYFPEDDIEIDDETWKDFADVDADDFGIFFRARWSYAPAFVEKLCRKKCDKDGKHFGRLIGTKCRCFCPLNAAELELCAATGLCDKFCASIGFHKGGDCVFNNVCFCYCKPGDEYNVWTVYTLEGSSTPAPVTNATTTTAPATNSTKDLNRPRPNPNRPRPKTSLQLINLRSINERI